MLPCKTLQKLPWTPDQPRCACGWRIGAAPS